MSQSTNKVFLTGASGLLGRSIHHKFKAEGWNVLGAALTRISGDLKKVDITNEQEVQSTIRTFQPDFIIHSAALRFPDRCDKNPEEANKLNVKATEYISTEAASKGIPVLYISTDYVFDGKNAPYQTDSKTNPVNTYGKTKLEGEIVTQQKSQDNIVLRVPVLYGPVTSLAESAVTTLLQNLLNSQKHVTISNYEKRRPSHVDDIASICFDLATKALKDRNINGIYQWSGEEVFTKYQMVLIMSDIFSLKMDHITPESNPGDTSAVARPYDVTLDSSRLKLIGIKHHTIFKDGLKRDLQKWVDKDK